MTDLLNKFNLLRCSYFRERREAEQRERQEKERRERMERERLERERREREREQQKLSAVEAVDHHFQLSIELAKKVIILRIYFILVFKRESVINSFFSGLALLKS